MDDDTGRMTVAALRAALTDFDDSDCVMVEGHGNTLADWSGRCYPAEIDGVRHAVMESNT
jgi:hypothetical protein